MEGWAGPYGAGPLARIASSFKRLIRNGFQG